MKKLLSILMAFVLLIAVVTVFALGDQSEGQNPSIHPAELKLEINHQGVTGKEQIWYAHNTMGVTGISLRDYDPSLTDKWYHVVPVDVSKDGKQSIYLVASYMYYIGTVTVEVNGDEVTTTYSIPGNGYEIYPESECLKWFTSMDEITADFLADPTSEMQFGTAISKEKDLGGQSIALLFICNKVTYCNPLNKAGDCLYAYCASVDSVMNYQADCLKLLEKMNEERAAKAAEEEKNSESEGIPDEESVPAGEETFIEAVETAVEETVETAEETIEAAAETMEAAEETAEAAEEAVETVEEMVESTEEAIETALETMENPEEATEEAEE